MIKKLTFVPVKRINGGTLFKAGNLAVKISYADGTVEGFISGDISDNPELFSEDLSRLKLESLTVVALGLTYFTTDITIVDGVSMEPTLSNRTLIVKSRSARKINRMLLSKNAIVKFFDPEGNKAIKRIVASPGDTIKFEGTYVKVNGQTIDNVNLDRDMKPKDDSQSMKDYARTLRKTEEYKLKDNQYFVMGDNRSNSVDSRKYGPINESDIISIIQK